MKFKVNEKNIPMLATVAVFLLIYTIGAISYSGFFSVRVFTNLLYDTAFVGVIAVGMTFVIISGGIDLSVGSMVALTSIITASLLESTQLHPIVVVLVVLALGAGFGLTMGSLIHYFSLPAFLVSLVGMFFARGMAYTVSLSSIPITNDLFSSFARMGIPLGPRGVSLKVVAIIFLVVVAIGVYLSHFSRFGRNVYAIGGNEKSSVLMGLPVGKTKLAIYTLSGTCSALGGIVYAMYTLSGYALAAVGLELDVIAAVVIGGTLLNGGIGRVEGTLIGVLILGLIQALITFQGTLSSWWTRIVIGVLLCLFILLQRYISHTSTVLRSGATD